MLTRKQYEVLMRTYKDKGNVRGGEVLKAAFSKMFAYDELHDAPLRFTEDEETFIRGVGQGDPKFDAEAVIRRSRCRGDRPLGFWQFLENGQLVCGGRIRVMGRLYERRGNGLYVDGTLVQDPESLVARPRPVPDAEDAA